MMFLTETNVTEITKKQYFYKLRAHYGIFTSLLLTQLIALLFSFMGSGSMGSGADGVMVIVTYYTGNVIIAFTMLWAFISGVSMNSKLVRDGDFSFVTNRLTSNLSSIAFLVTATVTGGITAMLGGSLLKTIIYFVKGDGILGHTYSVPLAQLLTGIIAALLYVTLFGALGYFASTLVQLSKFNLVLLPLLFVGSLFLEARMDGQGPVRELINFFATETSIFILALKVVAASGALFYTSILMSNKLEVRR
ncbi:hypothetical protein H1D32_05360 [Anaerobacillus sp. CMMVII]|uniref:hypothetical protein n=1 Tax=Anaerobacillus sp. CMMVII TaxID=2755588 RepID=UPI0021B8406C|nr:hypothetical protein [Anaerobacillus sp. CMMVII]MCT8137218.1 hypothetical protein [Anaerobacillus sp. CMMVII]